MKNGHFYACLRVVKPAFIPYNTRWISATFSYVFMYEKVACDMETVVKTTGGTEI